MNYNILELTLSYIGKWEKLIKLSNVNKLWREIIKTSKLVWKNAEVNLYTNENIYDKHLIEYKNDIIIAKYPIQCLICSENDNITDDCIKNLQLNKLMCLNNNNITDFGIIDLPLEWLLCNNNNNILKTRIPSEMFSDIFSFKYFITP